MIFHPLFSSTTKGLLYNRCILIRCYGSYPWPGIKNNIVPYNNKEIIIYNKPNKNIISYNKGNKDIIIYNPKDLNVSPINYIHNFNKNKVINNINLNNKINKFAFLNFEIDILKEYYKKQQKF
jgi:hypothetical protein